METKIPRPFGLRQASINHTAADNKENAVGEKRKLKSQLSFSEKKVKSPEGGVKPATARWLPRAGEAWPDVEAETGMDMESLLAVRMTGKGKFDYKGKCEQMSVYIKQLRAALRHVLDDEASWSSERYQLGEELELEKARHKETSSTAQQLQKEMSEQMQQLKVVSSGLETKLAESSVAKADLEARNSQLSQDILSEKVPISYLSVRARTADAEAKAVKADLEVQSSQSQLKEQQEANKQLLTYNNSLQEYNTKMQADLNSAIEASNKAQLEKGTLEQELGNVRDKLESCQTDLDSSRALAKDLESAKNDLTGEVSSLKAGLEQESATVRSLTQEKTALGEANLKLQQSLATSETKCAGLEATVSSLRGSLEQETTKVRSLSEENASLEMTKGSLQESILAADAKNAGLQENIVRLDSDIKALNAQSEQLTKEKAKLEGENSAISLRTEALQEEKESLVAQVSQVSEVNASLQAELVKARESLLTSEGRLAASEAREKELEEKSKATAGQLQACQAELESAQAASSKLAEEKAMLDASIASYESKMGGSMEELKRLADKNISLQGSFSEQAEVADGLRQQLQLASQKEELFQMRIVEAEKEMEGLRSAALTMERDLAEAEERNHRLEAIRKQLHNQVLELKGNIRVFCRVRPPSAEETKAEEDEMTDGPPVIGFGPNDNPDLAGRSLELNPVANGKPYNFTFDKVFDTQSTNEMVFEEISHLVQSALDGYKVCIFAYGQTGSGKTHTMMGNGSEGPHAGMIPRSMHQLFSECERLNERGWKFSMKACMLEIYNETLRDLLSPPAPEKPQFQGPGQKSEPAVVHNIKHDQNGNTHVTELTYVAVSQPADVEELMNRANTNRSVGKTAMNTRSSRSHCVFTLQIYASNEGTGEKASGVLNLIDLAGSERLARSGAKGDRLKETQAINKSLSALGDVIAALAERGPSSGHIPYRNSKLTYLLQPCLGRTCCFVFRT
eukprot:scaffold1536_cov397-Prasinococcus_capsulatus_cf.AAC.28